MASFFITSSGTNIGKTYVACQLIRQLRSQSISINALKPIISGYEPTHQRESDSGLLLTALGKEVNNETIQTISPWCFQAPLSPHMAAKQEHRPILWKDLVHFCNQNISKSKKGKDILLIEGAGGVMTPITDDKLTSEWIKSLNIPVILVVGSYLGSLSHTLTAYTTLHSQDIPVAGIIISESEESAMSLSDTVSSLSAFIPEEIPITSLPRSHVNARMEHQIIDLTFMVSSYE